MSVVPQTAAPSETDTDRSADVVPQELVILGDEDAAACTDGVCRP